MRASATGTSRKDVRILLPVHGPLTGEHGRELKGHSDHAARTVRITKPPVPAQGEDATRRTTVVEGRRVIT